MPTLNLSGDSLHERIDEDRKKWEETIPDDDKVKAIKGYRNYALGKQRFTITGQMEQFLATGTDGQTLANLFADNICHPVISQAADRIVFKGYRVDPAEGADETSVKPEQDFVDKDIFIKCSLSDLSGEIQYATFRDSNFAVLLSWSDEQERIIVTKQDWWDGESGMFVQYDEQGLMLYAVREWDDIEDRQKIKRRTVYFENRIERFISHNFSKWESFDPDNQGAVVPWVKMDGSPMHIPVVHFLNAGRETGNYGVSELAGGVRGFQDQINDLGLDIVVAARMTAYQMYYITGYKSPVNKPGEAVAPTFGPGATVTTTDPNAKVGVLPAGDLTQLLNALHEKKQNVCNMTQTPMHTITGDWPSGDALFRAEQPAVNKAKRQVEKLKPAYVLLAHRAMEIANRWGKISLNEDAMITAEFESVEQLGTLKEAMADRETATAAQTWVGAGRPLEDFLADKGWSEDRIKKLQERKQAAEAAQLEQDKARVDELMGSADNASGNGRVRIPA